MNHLYFQKAFFDYIYMCVYMCYNAESTDCGNIIKGTGILWSNQNILNWAYS